MSQTKAKCPTCQKIHKTTKWTGGNILPRIECSKCRGKRMSINSERSRHWLMTKDTRREEENIFKARGLREYQEKIMYFNLESEGRKFRQENAYLYKPARRYDNIAEWMY